MSKSKKSKIRDSARGEECQVRLVGICNGNSETTIFAHKGGGGMALKSNNAHGAYCCSACHDEVDGRTSKSFSRTGVMLDFYEGIFRTQLILIEKELIIIK